MWWGVGDVVRGHPGGGRYRLALGGSLNNAILVDNRRIVNPEGLRFEDEFVRHKVLDAIGDLSLIGMPVIGHYHAFKSGHLLNKLLINRLLSDKSAWSYIAMDEFCHLHGIDPRLNDAEAEELVAGKAYLQLRNANGRNG